MASNLTTADKAEIKSIVTDTMKSFGPIVPQASAEPEADVPTQVDTDPIMAIVDQKIAAIIDSLPTGNIILRGKRGSQLVNQSEESLNTISELLQNRKHYRTRSNIR